MSEIDPLVLELRAKVDQFERDLKRTTRTVDEQLGRQGARARKLEDEFRRSSGAISSSLKGLAGTLATAFAGRELVGLIDSYTRLQNQLKVAGLEGEQLASVQERLRVIGRTYGADLESLASTFSRIAQVQGDLGASTEDTIKLNEIVAASLKVAGTDAQAASGALLQLGQALGSGVVRAEEFNSVIEGALPLAQAAARGIEGYGGSVAKLRAAIAEGQVTSREFFEGVLRGGVQTIEDAERATLTLSGAFTALRNELVTYVGSNAEATGATGVLSNAILGLAENLEDVIEALSIIALAIGTRYVVGIGAAIIRTAGLSAAAIGLGVTLNGVAATARTAGIALSGAFGGPIGLAVGALVVGIGSLALASEDAAQKTERLKAETNEAANTADIYEQRLRDAGIAVDAFGDSADTARGKIAGLGDQMQLAARLALDLADNLRIADLAKIGSRLTDIKAERAEIARIDKLRAPRADGRGGDPEGIFGSERRAERRAQDKELAQQEAELIRQANAIRVGVANGIDVTSGKPTKPVAATSAPRASRTPRGRTGPNPAEIQARFLDEQARLDAEILQAKLSLATSAEDRASLEREILSAQAEQRRAEINGNKDLNPEQRKALLDLIEQLYGAAAQYDEQGKVIATFNNSLLAQEVALREQAEIEERNATLADERGRAAIDALRLQFDLATTEKDRRALALQILDAEQAILRERLQAQINSATLNDIDKERARIALAALDAQAGAQRESVNRQFASPLERYAESTRDSDQRVEEAAVRRIQELNSTITDAMANALGIKDPFLSELIRIFLDRNIFGPLAEALSGAGGGGGGLGSAIGSVLGSLFGRASGGRVNAGSVYRVNEGAGAGRVEAFRPDVSGQIIPLGRMNAVASGGAGGASGVVRVVIEEAPGFAARVRTEAVGVAIEVVRESAEPLINAAANETIRRANRRTL